MSSVEKGAENVVMVASKEETEKILRKEEEATAHKEEATAHMEAAAMALLKEQLEATAEEEVVVLNSSDGTIFKIHPSWATESRFIKSYMEKEGYAHGDIIPVEVKGDILSLVVQFLTAMFVDTSTSEGEEVVENWGKEMSETDPKTMVELFEAADYLYIPKLMKLASKPVAMYLTGKSPQEVREIFKIHTACTSGEDDKLRSQYPWAFE